MVYMEEGIEFRTKVGGALIEKELQNSVLRVDTGCVVAFEPLVDLEIKRDGGLKTMLFGGGGLFLATLRGTGKVWLQSMPIKKLIQAVGPYSKNSKKEEHSLFG